jgi:hypothetical protein
MEIAPRENKEVKNTPLSIVTDIFLVCLAAYVLYKVITYLIIVIAWILANAGIRV